MSLTSQVSDEPDEMMKEFPSGGTRERVHVVHVAPDPSAPGGMSAVLRGLLASKLSEQYALGFISTYRTRDPLARLLLFTRAAGALGLWCLRPGQRIAHIHTAMRGSLYRKALMVFIAKLLGRPVVLHIHAGAGDIEQFHRGLGPLRRAALRRALVAADRVLSVSRVGAEEIDKRFDCPGIVVVPNAAPPAAAGPRRPTPIEDTVNVLYLGGFANPVKGGAVLVQALPRMLSECPEARFVLAGPGEPPDPLLGLLDRDAVRWRGWLDVPTTAKTMGESDIFVLPSTSEGLPVAMLEAMAHGRAIVATRVGGVPEVLSHGVDSLLVEPGRPDEVAEAVARLVADASERERLGRAAAERAARLNDEDVCDRLDRIYRELTRASD